MLLRGNTSKDSKYLGLINRSIKGKLTHPKNQGVRMQAHHIISAEGVKMSGMGVKLEEFGYDINLGPNLVFLPCTLQGACHLKVQPHRGDHTAISERPPRLDDEEDDYDDDEHPFSYHSMIATRIHGLKLALERQCTGLDDPARSVVKKKMDELSREILNTIVDRPKRARLTNIADHFSLGNHVGCSGVDSVGDHDDSRRCPTERNHHESQGAGQRKEGIKHRAIGRYTPTVGE
jgi:hypothetical protein